MLNKVKDWKEVSDGFYEKALVLSLLFVLFLVLTLPHFEAKPYVNFDELIPLSIVPDLDTKPIPKPEMVKPNIIINFEDEFSDDEPDIPIVETIDPTLLTDEVILADVPTKFIAYDIAPVIIQQVPPKYPEFMKTMQIEGIVYLEVIVSETGDVLSVNILQSVFAGKGGLDEAAIEAVKQWKFQPATSGNIPVKCNVSLPIAFKLK